MKFLVLSVTIAAEGVQFLLGGLNDFAILSSWCSWAVFMSSRKWAMTVGTPGFLSAVGS